MNIYQRMAQVRASEAVRYIKKDAKVLDYKAISHDMVTAMCRQALLDAGIHESITVVESGFLDTEKKDKNGGKIFLYRAMFQVSFINIDKPDDRYSVNVEALALDSQDKHCGKAMSMAKKYALLKELDIETGENEESRNPELDEPQIATASEIESIRLFAEEMGVPIEVAEPRILKSAGVDELSKLSSWQVTQAKDWIARAASKMKEKEEQAHEAGHA